MKKIKIYGDSILKGVMFNEELNRYKLFGYRFNELAENGIEVENNCKMGATIEQGFEIMKDTLGDCDKDTVVILEYGGNDCNYNWSEVSNNPKGEFLPNTTAEKFQEVYLKMIDYARQKGATVAVCNLVPIDSERFMNWVSKGLNFDNILNWLGDINRIARWQEYYSHIAERVANLAKCPILDLRSNFLCHHSMLNMIGVDGMHPSPEGHTLIKEVFQKNILSTPELV
ncbi:MAG: SGNH/GDSL hydrolase family protein [Ruminococcaceae bacterium]|nr:SGNH/GDSL hydrolase family protein [Oscillospiraceae bacterium]